MIEPPRAHPLLRQQAQRRQSGGAGTNRHAHSGRPPPRGRRPHGRKHPGRRRGEHAHLVCPGEATLVGVLPFAPSASTRGSGGYPGWWRPAPSMSFGPAVHAAGLPALTARPAPGVPIGARRCPAHEGAEEDRPGQLQPETRATSPEAARGGLGRQQARPLGRKNASPILSPWQQDQGPVRGRCRQCRPASMTTCVRGAARW